MHFTHVQRFANRKDAGRDLAKQLTKFAGARDVIVLAIPNGGVPVAVEIAGNLHLPFDVLLVGKITTPGCGDKALGAVTGGGVRMLNPAMIDSLHLSQSDISDAVLRECMELARREKLYRGRTSSLDVADRTVILVDDGTTPCATIRDAIRLLRRQHVDRIVVALPSACHHAACDLRLEADELVTLAEPSSAIPAGRWFKHFPRTTDAEVRHLLARRNMEASAGY